MTYTLIDLKQIAAAGGSIVLGEPAIKAFTITDFKQLASALKDGATLTLIHPHLKFSVTQLKQLAASNPGHVIFDFS